MDPKIQALLSLLPQLVMLVADATQIAGTAPAVPAYLRLLATILGQAEPSYVQLVALTDAVAQMVKEEREPTDEEWAALARASDASHLAIQSYDIDAETGELYEPAEG